MSLLDQIKQDYKQAFKAKDTVKKDILNYLISQIKNKQIDLWHQPSDEDIIKIIKKEIKSRQESISFLEKSGKVEEAEIEKKKINILKQYLPEMLSEDQLKKIVEEKIKELNISDLRKERWKLIWAIMKQYWPQVDGKLLNQVIQSYI